MVIWSPLHRMKFKELFFQVKTSQTVFSKFDKGIYFLYRGLISKVHLHFDSSNREFAQVLEWYCFFSLDVSYLF